jgi:tripartite-type tricarboxylate transporter receptor subunit TctC
MRKLLAALIAASLGLGWTGVAAADGYPARPITMIVPFPAGGATDTLARFLSEQMRAILGLLKPFPAFAGSAPPLPLMASAYRESWFSSW